MMMFEDDSIGGTRPEEPEVVLDGLEDLDPVKPLAGYVLSRYRNYDNNRQVSGAESDILDSLKAYNMKYTAKDLARIAEEGSSPIFVGLTSAKARALSSFIKDILLGSEKPYSIEPTAVPQLPENIEAQVEEYFENRSGEIKNTKDLKDVNESRRDLEESLAEELLLLAKHAFRRTSREIEDNLQEGEFYKALSEFIDDFSWSPTAILKGPIVTKQNKLTWSDGKPVVEEEFIFFNKRVNPLDFYPSPDQSIFIEKLRFSISELNDLIGVKGYDEEVIRDAINNPVNTQSVLDNSVDQDIVDEELQGGDTYSEEIQGLHWHGAVPVSYLEDQGIDIKIPKGAAAVHLEILMIGSSLLKVCVNKDPLSRHPYYFSSFQRRPGSFWGTSLPKIMDPEQRLCNATVRALAMNLGLSASPQCVINIDRLADDGEIDEIFGGKIWQVKADAAGNSGKPLEFFNVPSNANELLAVFNRFLELADETTGIPRYAYGAQTNMGGAGGTMGGMAMLLEQSTKTIKEAVRHIDKDVIIPRVKYEFSNVMLKSNGKYTGDINVIALGSQSLTNKAAEQLKRNEFLQITANQFDQSIMGTEGRALLLKEMAKDMNLPEAIVPNRMELKQRAEQEQKTQEEGMKIEMEKINIPIKVAETQGQLTLQGIQMSNETRGQANQIEATEVQNDFEIGKEKNQLKEMEITVNAETKQRGDMLKAQSTAGAVAQKADQTNKSIALSLKTADTPAHDKSQQ